MSSSFEVTFKWPHVDANEVIVTGSFDKWSSSVPLTKNATGFTGTASVPWGEKIEYKFIVDGRWTTHEGQPTETDQSGNLNNVFTAPMKPPTPTVIKPAQGAPVDEETKSATEDVAPPVERASSVSPTPSDLSKQVKAVGASAKLQDLSRRSSFSQRFSEITDTVLARDGANSTFEYVASGLGAAIHGVVGIDPINADKIDYHSPRPDDQFVQPEPEKSELTLVAPLVPIDIVPVNNAENNQEAITSAEHSTHTPVQAEAVEPISIDAPVVLDAAAPEAAPIVAEVIPEPSTEEKPDSLDAAAPEAAPIVAEVIPELSTEEKPGSLDAAAPEAAPIVAEVIPEPSTEEKPDSLGDKGTALVGITPDEPVTQVKTEDIPIIVAASLVENKDVALESTTPVTAPVVQEIPLSLNGENKVDSVVPDASEELSTEAQDKHTSVIEDQAVSSIVDLNGENKVDSVVPDASEELSTEAQDKHTLVIEDQAVSSIVENKNNDTTLETSLAEPKNDPSTPVVEKNSTSEIKADIIPPETLTSDEPSAQIKDEDTPLIEEQAVTSVSVENKETKEIPLTKLNNEPVMDEKPVSSSSENKDDTVVPDSPTPVESSTEITDEHIPVVDTRAVSSVENADKDVPVDSTVPSTELKNVPSASAAEGKLLASKVENEVVEPEVKPSDEPSSQIEDKPTPVIEDQTETKGNVATSLENATPSTEPANVPSASLAEEKPASAVPESTAAEPVTATEPAAVATPANGGSVTPTRSPSPKTKSIPSTPIAEEKLHTFPAGSPSGIQASPSTSSKFGSSRKKRTSIFGKLKNIFSDKDKK